MVEVHSGTGCVSKYPRLSSKKQIMQRFIQSISFRDIIRYRHFHVTFSMLEAQAQKLQHFVQPPRLCDVEYFSLKTI